MLYLREYQARSSRLSDHLPWAALIGPGLVLNKDGSFQKTLRFRGPDLASATDGHLMSVRAQLNNALRRLGSRWCLHVEAERRPSQHYPDGRFPDAVSKLVDDERRDAFVADGQHFESLYYLTFTHLPPEENVGRAESLLVENLPKTADGASLYRASLADFLSVVAQVTDILRAVMPEVEELGDEGTLTYLHACISTKRHPVARPEPPAYLDALLTDDDFEGGLSPKLGAHFLRTISIRAYPSSSSPGVLDRLNALGVGYRWVCRYLPLDKEDARQALNTVRKRWFAKRKGLMALLKEAVAREPAVLEDQDALAKAQDADAALMILGADAASMGYFTPTVTVSDPDPDRLAAKVRQVEASINRAGFVTKTEDVNAVEAWLGSLPGQAYADCRRPLVSTLNLCDMIPMSAVWPGPTVNHHLTSETRKRGWSGPQPPLVQTRTAGSTPFRFDLHQGDVGHAMVIGPTGAGKSVLLNTLALQWRRYPEAEVVFFDKGRSARATTLLVGGSFFDLGGGALSFQPLSNLDAPGDRAWAQAWVQDLVAAEGVALSPEVKDEIWTGLANLAAGPRAQRTLTVLAATIQDSRVKAALLPYTLNGPHGQLLDAGSEVVLGSAWQAFEMATLMGNKSAVAPVLTYLFHALEARFDGRPVLLILDEAWVFLADTAFASKIEEWLRTLRKLNVAVVFATQSLQDIANAPISAVLMENCPTRIFLPNPDAQTPRVSALYEGFGLNAQQIRIIAQACPKREYYYQSSAGNRLFELGLGPAALAAAGASSAADHRIIDEILADPAAQDFAAAFYARRGLPAAAAALRGAAIPHPTSPMRPQTRDWDLSA